MAKDDYDVIVFKILTYLYACLKRKITFDIDTFNNTISIKDIDEDYFSDVLLMMSEEGLISGFNYKKVWGGNIIPLSDPSDLKITSTGVRYLGNNNKMKEIRENLLNTAKITSTWIISLIKLLQE